MRSKTENSTIILICTWIIPFSVSSFHFLSNIYISFVMTVFLEKLMFVTVLLTNQTHFIWVSTLYDVTVYIRMIMILVMDNNAPVIATKPTTAVLKSETPFQQNKCTCTWTEITLKNTEILHFPFWRVVEWNINVHVTL